MKLGFAVLGALLCGSAVAQTPDVLVKIDVLLHYRTEQNGKTTFRAYDSLGNYGTVGLSFILEPGFQVFVSQRLQKIRGNADNDQLDQIYIEDRGLWKLGKQIMPFGRNGLLKESVYGGRIDTNLGSDAFPASLAAVDGGRGLQRGFMGRIGSNVGISFAIGERFGIDASSLTVIRRPEDSPGRFRGYKEVFGVDLINKVGRLDVRAEHAIFRRGETEQDESKEVTDVLFMLNVSPQQSVGFGWSRDSADPDSHFRLLGKFPLGATAWAEPILKLHEGEVQSFGLSMRVRF